MALDQQLLDRVLDSPQLPSLPAIALQIISLVQEDEADVDKIAETISLDPALSSKMLKTVNSSFYGLPKTVASVHQAVIVLGLNSVKTLALGFSLVNNLTGSGGDGFNHMAFWRRSLYSATAAKQLCERLHIVQAEEVFIASLLQDVGVLAMAQVLGDEYAQIMQQAGDDHRKLGEAERDALGGDHTDIGAALAESWGLPPLLVESIRLHERPDEAPENLIGLIRTVAAGGIAAELIEHPDDAERVGTFYRVMAEWFELEQQGAESLLQAVFKQASETQRLFDLPTGELGSADDILSRARQAAERLSQQSPAPAPETIINQTEPDAPADANTDAFTGLGNRRRFDEQLDERFLSSGAGSPLSVILIDIDRFKQFNETQGQVRGDALLKAVSAALKSDVDARGEVFRFSGDQFSVLCPGMALHDAALLAEQLRKRVETTSDRECGDPPATVSIGAVTYEGQAFKRPDQLIKAAAKGVAAAKRGGRNMVRVFVPKGESGSKAA